MPQQYQSWAGNDELEAKDIERLSSYWKLILIFRLALSSVGSLLHIWSNINMKSWSSVGCYNTIVIMSAQLINLIGGLFCSHDLFEARCQCVTLLHHCPTSKPDGAIGPSTIQAVWLLTNEISLHYAAKPNLSNWSALWVPHCRKQGGLEGVEEVDSIHEMFRWLLTSEMDGGSATLCSEWLLIRLLEV